MTLGIELCGIRMNNPLILASGILGVTKASLGNVVRNGAGAVTIKSISRDPRKGHSNPIIITYEAGMMNAVGYSNPGIESAKEEFRDLSGVGAPVFASIIGKDPDEFAYMAKNFLTSGFAAVEVPLSCPHTPGFGTLAGQGTPEMTRKITEAVVKNTDLPVFIKVSPNTEALGEVAKAAEKGGASGITAVNTLGPGMVIDIRARQPILDFRVGGISGPALRPVAVRCVFDIYKAVKIPIIGLGGVTSGRDAIEMIMAGATAVGVGSAVHYRGIEVFRLICEEMEAIMEEEGIKDLSKIRGAAHG